MPLTEFQRAVLRLLAQQRGPESFVAGGSVINAAPESPRYSDDVDTLYLDGSYASLGLLAWAAAGKDPGLTPLLILEQANRCNRPRPEDFLAVLGTDQFDFVAMKTRWRESVDTARGPVAALPPGEAGALYLDADDRPVNPRQVSDARLHYPPLGGTLPRVAGSVTPLPDYLERRVEEQTRKCYQKDQ